MTRADTLATPAPARIDAAVAQELIDAIEAYTKACEELAQAELDDRYDSDAVVEVNLEYMSAQWRLEAAFVAATGWKPTFHPAEYRRDEGPVTAKPSDPPYWTIA
jgi:hypothetical protein